MITLKAAQTTYIAGYGRGENRQPMTSYALGGRHQGNGLANDVFAMRLQPQFGAICCVVAATLAGAVASTGSFDKALEQGNTYALALQITEQFPGISKKNVERMISVIKANGPAFTALIGKNVEDPKLIKALKAETELWEWLEQNTDEIQ